MRQKKGNIPLVFKGHPNIYTYIHKHKYVCICAFINKILLKSYAHLFDIIFTDYLSSAEILI